MKSSLKKLRHRSYNIKIYYKVILILIILIIVNFLPKISYADEYHACKLNSNYKINKITVKINKNKKWIKNNIKILISNTRTIPKKLRKRFKGQVIVHYTNGSECILEAKIRQNGDFKDHFIYIDNSVKQSLDVKLSNGNLGGIVSFKLLLDGTRGNSEDEIFLTELLRELNFISPRSQMVEANINNLNAKMIFQENSKKELLEYNGKSESPIYESNENDFFKSLEKFKNNNLTDDEIGLKQSLDQAIMGLLARQTNAKWTLKSAIHSKISLRALSNLNLIYVNSINNLNQINKDNLFNYQFDNTFLGNQNKQNIIKLDKYNLILKTANAEHALVSHNRKFYWNKLEEYFEPIYNDGNPNIFKNNNIKLDLPVSAYIKEALVELEASLKNLDFKKLKENLNMGGSNFTSQDIEKKLSIIYYNLSKLKVEINNLDLDLIQSEKKLRFDQSALEEAINNKKNNNSESIFIFKKNKLKNDFLSCEKYIKCKEIKLDENEQVKLISGDLIKHNQDHIYLGYYPYLKTEINDNKFNFVKFNSNEINFYFNDGIEYKFDKKKNEFNILQTKPEARAYFFNSNLKNLNINFKGYKNFDNLKFFPFDLKGLTGCLTFYNSKFDNVNLKSEESNCEDSINMINVYGKINNVLINNSYSDALDIDFSKIDINKIIIKNSKNDCVDVSFGEYNFGTLDLDICGDKGLSVGETSKISVKNINVNNSLIGVASKDGSIANIFSANIRNVDTCLESYNKKQEFSGGYIKVNKFNCTNFVKQSIFDSQSKIILEN